METTENIWKQDRTYEIWKHIFQIYNIYIRLLNYVTTKMEAADTRGKRLITIVSPSSNRAITVSPCQWYFRPQKAKQELQQSCQHFLVCTIIIHNICIYIYMYPVYDYIIIDCMLKSWSSTLLFDPFLAPWPCCACLNLKSFRLERLAVTLNGRRAENCNGSTAGSQSTSVIPSFRMPHVTTKKAKNPWCWDENLPAWLGDFCEGAYVGKLNIPATVCSQMGQVTWDRQVALLKHGVFFHDRYI